MNCGKPFALLRIRPRRWCQRPGHTLVTSMKTRHPHRLQFTPHGQPCVIYAAALSRDGTAPQMWLPSRTSRKGRVLATPPRRNAARTVRSFGRKRDRKRTGFAKRLGFVEKTSVALFLQALEIASRGRGGTGRHKRLKISRSNPYGFDPRRPHQTSWSLCGGISVRRERETAGGLAPLSPEPRTGKCPAPPLSLYGTNAEASNETKT